NGRKRQQALVPQLSVNRAVADRQRRGVGQLTGAIEGRAVEGQRQAVCHEVVVELHRGTAEREVAGISERAILHEAAAADTERYTAGDVDQAGVGEAGMAAQSEGGADVDRAAVGVAGPGEGKVKWADQVEQALVVQ